MNCKREGRLRRGSRVTSDLRGWRQVDVILVLIGHRGNRLDPKGGAWDLDYMA